MTDLDNIACLLYPIGDRGVQGQKSDLILNEGIFHCGSNAANRVTKFSTVLEIRAVEVRAFFTLLGNLGSKIG